MKPDHIQSIKEVARHILYRTGFHGVLSAQRQRRGYAGTDHLQPVDAAERFSAIYEQGVWHHSKDQDSLSGEGSEVAAAATVVSQLPTLVADLHCRKFLDVGCGDWNWMGNVTLPCEYMGVDIVPTVIAANQKAARPGVTFAVVDAIAGPLPKADVALCREILFHLSFSDANAVLANVRKAATWLIATTDTSIWFNSDIPTGDYRKLNLERAPYRFPAPRKVIVDDAVSKGRILGLWKTEDLPA